MGWAMRANPMAQQAKSGFLRRDIMAPSEKPIVVRSNGHFVERVDPATCKCTGESQQFLKAIDGKLTILPKTRWVEDPVVIDVARTEYR